MTIGLSTQPYAQFYDANGNPLSGGLIYTYLAGSLTARATYTDQGGLTQNANPVVLDSAGRADIWLDNSASYKFIVKDSAGTTIHTTDNVAPFSTASGLSVLGSIAANTIVGNNTGSSATPVAMTVAQTLALLSGSLLTGFKNAFTNGDFKVWQRGTTYALTSSLSYGSADRWVCSMATSAAGIANRDTSVTAGLGFQYNLKLGRNSASALTNIIQLMQGLESANSIPLAGKDVVISYYAKAGANYSAASSLFHIILCTGTGTDQSVTGNPGSWTNAANVISVDDTLTTSWQRFQHTVTLATTVTQVGTIMYYTPVGTAGADDNVYLTGVQLELGTTASTFESRPMQQELALCTRTYEKSFAYGQVPAVSQTQTGAITAFLPTGASGTFGQSIQMIPKRTAPTITTYNPVSANANWRDTTNAADRVVTVGLVGENSFSISGASGVAGAVNRIHWAADAEV